LRIDVGGVETLVDDAIDDAVAPSIRRKQSTPIVPRNSFEQVKEGGG
jgi:hypothetical protein